MRGDTLIPPRKKVQSSWLWHIHSKLKEYGYNSKRGSWPIFIPSYSFHFYPVMAHCTGWICTISLAVNMGDFRRKCENFSLVLTPVEEMILRFFLNCSISGCDYLDVNTFCSNFLYKLCLLHYISQFTWFYSIHLLCDVCMHGFYLELVSGFWHACSLSTT